MLFLYQRHNVIFELLKIGMACFIFIYNLEINGNLAPRSKFDDLDLSSKKEFLLESAILFGILYATTHNLKNALSLYNMRKNLSRIRYILHQNGLDLSIDEIGYFNSQPEVTYYIVRIANNIKVIRVFDANFIKKVYPAKVLSEIKIRDSDKIVQLITEDSHALIGFAENKTSKKIGGLLSELYYTVFIPLPSIVSLYAISQTIGQFLINLYPSVILAIFSLCFITYAPLKYFISSRFSWIDKNIKKRISDSDIKEQDGFEYIMAKINSYSALSTLNHALKSGQKTLLAIETDWLNGVYIKKHVDDIIKTLNKKIINLNIINSNAENLFTDIMDDISQDGNRYSKIIVISSNKTITTPRFNWLKKRGVFCISIDDSEIKKNACAIEKGEELYIDMLELLDISIKIASKAEISDSSKLKVLYDPEIDPCFAILIPKPIAMNRGGIEKIHEIQLSILRSL